MVWADEPISQLDDEPMGRLDNEQMNAGGNDIVGLDR